MLETKQPHLPSRYEPVTQPVEKVSVEVSILELDIINLIRHSSPFATITILKKHNSVIRITNEDSLEVQNGRLQTDGSKGI